jgi:hypothetical protein
MKRYLAVIIALVVCVAMHAEGSIPLENVSTSDLNESKSFAGNNGDAWTIVGLRNSTVGEYKALTIKGSVSGNGISGTLGSTSVEEGVGEVIFSISGANSATKGYSVDRVFVVKVGSKTVNVTGNVKTIGTVYELRAEIKQREVSSLSITMQEGVSGEDIRINIFNIHWTSYDGKTDKPELTVDGSNCEYVAANGDTTYYAPDKVNVLMSSASEGATIYYTTDGSNPTKLSSSGTSVAIPAGTNVTLNVAAWTEDKGMSDIVTKSIRTAVGKVTMNPCESSSFWPDCSIASSETENRGKTKSGVPYFRIKSASVIYTPPVLCPAGLSVYAAKKSEASITIAYQKGSMVYENGSSTWVGGEWQTLSELTKDILSTGMQRCEIPLTGIAPTDIVRFRIKSGGISLYVDDIDYIERYLEQTATPTASVAAGAVTSGTAVSLSSETGATIYYSVDDGNTYSVYSSAITINSPTTLMAYAVKDGKSTSWSIKNVYTISDAPQQQLTAPTFSVASGSEIMWGSQVTIQVSDALATLHYSLNGSAEVTATGDKELTLKGENGENITISAYLTREGYTQSETANASYTIKYGSLEAPVFSLDDNASVPYGNTVTISVAAGVKIMYAVNGKNNIATESVSVPITEDVVITAYAAQDGHVNSNTVMRTYSVVLPQADKPEFSHPEGEVPAGTGVTVLGVKGDTIYYSLNGGDWQYILGGAAWTITETTQISAYRAHKGMLNSDVVSVTYTVPKTATPTFSLPSGEYEKGTSVTISAEPGAIIHYTINGLSETTSTENPVTITIEYMTVISAYATMDGKADSEVAYETYTIKDTATDVENVQKSVGGVQKIVRDGRILIIREDGIFDVNGSLIR